MKNEENKHIENEDDQGQVEESNDQPGDDTNFIQDFIERKKLQNRILREIIDHIKPSEKD